MITILGIDPGYGTIGYGVVRFDNMKFTPVQYGAAKTAPGTPVSYTHLYQCQGDSLTILFAETSVEAVLALDAAVLTVKTDAGDTVEVLAGYAPAGDYRPQE